MKREIKKLSKRVVTGLFAIVILTSGCGGEGEKEKQTSNKDVTADIKAKYAQEEKYDYTDPMYDLERDHAFKYKIDNQKFADMGVKKWTELVEVYSDSDLTKEVGAQWILDKSEKEGELSTLSVTPAREAKYAIPDKEFGGKLNDQGEYADWGNAQQYYLVQHYDLETGEKFEKPQVTVFSIKTEINGAPNVQFYISEDGFATLEWDKVKGAEEYIIFSFDENIENPESRPYISIIDTTTETVWKDVNEKDPSKNNRNFRISFGGGEDEYYNELKKKLKDGEIDKEQFVKESTYDPESDYDKEKNKYIGVIAVSKKGTSKVSNFIDKKVAAKQTPVDAATYMNEGGIRPSYNDKAKTTVDKEINLLSSHVWVRMGDGKVTQKLVTYDIKNVKETRTTVHYYKADDDGKAVLDENGKMILEEVKTVPVLSIQFNVEGTPIKGYAEVQNYDKDSYKKELKELKKRQDGLRDKTGTVNKDSNLDGKTEESEEVAEEVRDEKYDVFASNALSEYLAIQMLNGNTTVNLDEFKEASDKEYLLDAWYEALYQNPLVLGVKGIRYDAKNNNVTIIYDDDASTQRSKQKEVQEKVKEVVKEIIKDDMTDLEKEEAINKYLCSTAEYDTDALKSAEKNNFKKVDEKYNDSFTAYGILINNKGVCASYAAAFKLLADEAGLESIVVTGNLDGTLPHAWNRVKIDDEWLSLDVTNNDNEFIVNALFNIPDSLANKVLVEDDLYIMNSELSKYVATSEDKEYYHYNDKFYSTDEIVDQLVKEYNEKGSTMLRTNYNISDDEFYAIAKKVIEKTGNEDLKGTYYLGVIYLTK
ncbi:hypothetical protein LJC02_04665 [Breznakia sp. OttesenSCG-928-G09]|nr:hypothetical protein [Breznakia sp. OttesenSCG-928-G09]